MILFSFLLITILVMLMLATIFAGFGTLSIVVVFGDVIVFGLLIWLVVKLIKRFKKG